MPKTSVFSTHIILLLPLVLLTAVSGTATGGPAPEEITAPANYWGDIDAFLEAQYAVSLAEVVSTLEANPPGLPEPPERRAALYLLDAVMHDPAAPERQAVQTFHHDRIASALHEMETSRPSTGAIVWKLYDHGFVVRTASVTIGFDLTRGYSSGVKAFAVDDAVMAAIIRQCDILFISHYHEDHADDWVARQFADAGKTVVAPPDVFEDEPFHSRITHPERTAHEVQKLTVTSGLTLDMVIYPGHQGDIPNNVSLVTTPEGISVCHTGDQSAPADFVWIDTAHEHHTADILLPNCWTLAPERMADGFDAGVIVTGHENELGHTIDHREPYWLTYRRFAPSPRPLVVMTWGESFRYIPE